MVTGIINRFWDPVTMGFNTQTSKEDIIEYLKGRITLLCNTVGLEIMEELTDETADNSVIFYIGKPGDSRPLLCIGNSGNASYFYASMFVSLVTYNNNVYQPAISVTRGPASAGTNDNYSFQNGGTTNYINLKYFVTANGDILLGFAQGTTTLSFSFFITDMSYPMENEDVTTAIAVKVYTSSYYPSDVPEANLIGNESLFQLMADMNSNSPYVSLTKDCLIDSKIQIAESCELEKPRLFSNMSNISDGKIANFNGARYLVLGKYSTGYPSLVFKVD